jgi:hypothetical protein
LAENRSEKIGGGNQKRIILEKWNIGIMENWKNGILGDEKERGD